MRSTCFVRLLYFHCMSPYLGWREPHGALRAAQASHRLESRSTNQPTIARWPSDNLIASTVVAMLLSQLTVAEE